MPIYNVKLNKEKLLSLPEDERNLFIAIAHLQNEIKFSLYGVAWTGKYDYDNEAIAQSQISLNSFYLRMLAGKLHEGWQLLQKYYFSNKTISKEFDEKAKTEACESLDELKQYFSKTNAISKIRNNLSFHYNPEALAEPLPRITDELDVYVSKENGANTLYYFAEVLANWALISHVENPAKRNPLEVLNKELISTAKSFNSFNMQYLSYVAGKYKSEIWLGEAKEIEFENLMKFKDVKIPVFTDTSDGFI